MKCTTEDIEQIHETLIEALDYVKQARRVSKKVYGDEREVGMQLKYAYAAVERAADLLRGGAAR